MNKIHLFLLITTLYSCTETAEEHEHKMFYQRHAELLNHKQKHHTSIWKQELMSDFINHCNNPLIALSQKDTTIKEEWLFDRTENTDSVTYLVYHIGHEVSEEDGCLPRFVTDGWVFIDSVKQVLYEYDIVKDRLQKWGK